jgi:hypothetical protein
MLWEASMMIGYGARTSDGAQRRGRRRHRVRPLDGIVGYVEELLVDCAHWTTNYIRSAICRWRPGDRCFLRRAAFERLTDRGGRYTSMSIVRGSTITGVAKSCG